MILLCNPNNRIQSYYAGIEQPLWLGLYATHLRNQGKEVNIIDAEVLNLSIDETVSQIRDWKPSVVVFVCMGSNPSVSSSAKMPVTKKIVDILIGEYDIKVAGLHVTALPQQTKAELGVDVLRGKIFEGTPDMPYDLLPMDKYISHNWHSELIGLPRKPYAVTYTSLGCAMGCHFCLPKSTKVLTADLTWVDIDTVKVGDKIIGVEHVNTKCSYCETVVTKTFKREKQQVYKISTECGTVYSTEDHPWLMRDRWKSIKDITDNIIYNASFNSSRSVLSAVSPPNSFKESSCYRKGYLAGVAVGDGSFESEKYKGDTNKYTYRFRLVGDTEMYGVFMDYAKKEGIESHIGNYNSGINSVFKYLKTGVYVTKSKYAVRLASFINKEINSEDYRRGFLSGIYDSEGSFSCNVLRIASNNILLKMRVYGYLESLGFKSVIEKDSVRLVGSFSDKLRFFTLVHPNVIHKKNIKGISVMGKAKIIKVEKSAICDVYNLETSSGNFIADGFVTHNCTVATQYGYQRKVWYRDIDAFINEIDLLVNKYGVHNIKFYDEHFTVNHERVNLICDKLIERRYDLNIWAYARVDSVEPKMLDKMWKAGINWLGYGFESGSDEILNGVNKRAGKAQARYAVKITHDAGININGNFLFGLNGDTRETMRDTLEFAKSLKLEYVNFYVTEQLPGTKYYEGQEKDWSKFGQFSPNQPKSIAKEYRDKAFNSYFSDPDYLNRIGIRFGQNSVKHIKDMLANGKPLTKV